MSGGVKRDRDGNERAKNAPDGPRGRFHDMFAHFRDELDEHHDRRERIVKASRDVTAQSKKIIFALQRVKTLNKEFPAGTQKDMDARMAEIARLLASVAPDLQSLNRHRYTWPMRCLEELVEALSFAHYLRHQRLITPAEAQAAIPVPTDTAQQPLSPPPPPLELTPGDYMYGVFDLFGELMRFATVQRAQVIAPPEGPAGEAAEGGRTILRDIQELGCAFEMLPGVPTKDFRNKMDAMRQSVRKVENLGYGLVVRGKEDIETVFENPTFESYLGRKAVAMNVPQFSYQPDVSVDADTVNPQILAANLQGFVAKNNIDMNNYQSNLYMIGGSDYVGGYALVDDGQFAGTGALTDTDGSTYTIWSSGTESAEPLPASTDVFGPFEQPPEGAMLTRTTFYVSAGLGTAEDGTGSAVSGQMYVERLQPLLQTHPHPIILIHGDYHTGQIWNTKPDGRPGWASYFVYQGYLVYVVDLPGCGRSTFSWAGQPHLAARSNTLDATAVERDLTAPAKQEYEAWPTAGLHDKWPGEGVRGDDIFENYYASLGPLPLRKAERQGLSQDALSNLLQRTGRAALVGEGTGATMAWLAADAVPHLVAGVVAIEPAGPPAGNASRPCSDGVRRYSPLICFDPTVRQYGIAEIPLTYDPPVGAAVDHNGVAVSDSTPLEFQAQTFTDDEDGRPRTCMMQRVRWDALVTDETGGLRLPQPRQLVNLSKVPHAVVTAPASSHSTYDWATVQYLRQAGVEVLHLRLEHYNMWGNGHLMFLEDNSDQVASLVMGWIDLYAADHDHCEMEGAADSEMLA
ncbi:hypothetical protein O9K51_03854 [Purpureocillium lavendulum]|uniref:AB hydrolase-1 domain-containing protein n=1 Tax=Purpureocillium lavendulum TaxID=1247861 RepID=A0AB34FU82_9HYPO|nr:hypothetical protein O9K51_03854 [Purpureocillium lavendulum]